MSLLPPQRHTKVRKPCCLRPSTWRPVSQRLDVLGHRPLPLTGPLPPLIHELKRHSHLARRSGLRPWVSSRVLGMGTWVLSRVVWMRGCVGGRLHPRTGGNFLPRLRGTSALLSKVSRLRYRDYDVTRANFLTFVCRLSSLDTQPSPGTDGSPRGAHLRALCVQTRVVASAAPAHSRQVSDDRQTVAGHDRPTAALRQRFPWVCLPAPAGSRGPY
jgi:hypothetical protein